MATIDEQNCQRKRHYRSEAAARAKAAELRNDPRRGSLRIYRCPHCKRWALTSKSEEPCQPRGRRLQRLGLDRTGGDG